MVGFTDRVSQGILNHVTGKTSIFAVTTPMYVALFTAVGIDAGTGFTEVTGGGYTRASMAAANWNAASGSSPSSVTNSVTATFPASTAAWGTVIAFGLYDAGTSGNLLMWDFLGAGAWLPFDCTLASPGVVTSRSHGFVAASSVVFTSEFGGTLPTGITGLSVQTVAASPTTDTFNVGLNTTTAGNGSVRQVVALAIGSAGITPSLAAGNITLTSS